jgi:hypothetical protein
MPVNPLTKNNWFKTERHNSCRPANLYAKHVEQAINIYGTTIFYFPVSEYNLDGLAALWGEDVSPEYHEKYTLKAMTEGENDNFTFNQYGIDKTTAERVALISKKQFSEITGREEPLELDHFHWTQNDIVYEVISVEDQEGIVLGQEMYWKLTGTPRIVSGEIFGDGTCEDEREQVVDPDQAIDPCETTDGNIVDNPDIIIPGPTPHVDDEEIVDRDKDGILIRNSWGNWLILLCMTPIILLVL